MQMRVPATIITKGLDRGDSARLSAFGINRSVEALAETASTAISLWKKYIPDSPYGLVQM
jgi:hypothetical protein